MSRLRYQDYTAASTAYLGDLPSHWKVSRFSRHVGINGGQVDPRDDRYRHMSLIAPNHVESGTGKLLALHSADEQGADSGKYLVRRGQVIYSKIRPNLVKAVLAPVECLCSADMYGLEPHHQTLRPGFLWYMLLSKPFTDYVVDSSMRVAMPKVNHESLGAAPIWLPPLVEQEAIERFIASETAKIDALIAKQEQLIATLREDRTATITHAVTKGLDPGVEMKDSDVEWLGRVPAHWQVLKATWIGKPFGSEGVSEEDVNEAGDIAFLKVSSLHPHALYPESPTWFVGKRYRSERNFIAFPKRGAAIFGNKVNIVRDRAVIDPNLMGWKLEAGNVLEFYAQVLKLIRLEEIADVSTVPQINTKHIASLRLPQPPLAEQKAIVAALAVGSQKIDVLIAKAIDVIETLREYRSALIADAVTGKIDVRGAA